MFFFSSFAVPIVVTPSTRNTTKRVAFALTALEEIYHGLDGLQGADESWNSSKKYSDNESLRDFSASFDGNCRHKQKCIFQAGHAT
jgi:hypothetical protein